MCALLGGEPSLLGRVVRNLGERRIFTGTRTRTRTRSISSLESARADHVAVPSKVLLHRSGSE
jgi:hypothetical protein